MLQNKLLIWKFNRGRKESLRCIYEKHKDYLVTLAAALLTDVSSAEDVVQDVFLSFIESAEKFRLTGSLKSYLATCVANNARNRNRANQRHHNIALGEANPAAAASNSPEFSAIFGEGLRQLSLALRQLPYEQREVLILHVYSGMKFKAIARQQDASINTVQGRYRYALNKLRSMLDSEVKK